MLDTTSPVILEEFNALVRPIINPTKKAMIKSKRMNENNTKNVIPKANFFCLMSLIENTKPAIVKPISIREKIT